MALVFSHVLPSGAIAQDRIRLRPTTPDIHEGRWVPADPPAHNADTHIAIPVQPVPADATQIEYTLQHRGIPVLKAYYTRRVQAHLDMVAYLAGYDNIVSACSYSGAQNPFYAESLAFIVWRSAVWAFCFDLLARIQAGTAEIPGEEELILMLPVLELA